MCAFGCDFLLCPILGCSCALPSAKAFAALLRNSLLEAELEAELFEDLVLGVNVPLELGENPAALAQTSHLSWCS